MESKEVKIKEKVKERYTAAVNSTAGSCCGPSRELPAERVVSCAGYASSDLQAVPEDAIQSSFGCGNPVAFADLRPGEVVMDIGSGAGLDCLLAAERVGPLGKVIGIDMTPAMLERATRNAKRAGARNVEFRAGDAENMPVDDSSVDCILSNCVINLSPNKPQVFREAFRVLKPGGRLSISDIMVEWLPPFARSSTRLYSSCIAGAIPENLYVRQMEQAGFDNVTVGERLVYDVDQIMSFAGETAFGRILPRPVLRKVIEKFVAGKIWSARIHAIKPLEQRLQ